MILDDATSQSAGTVLVHVHSISRSTRPRYKYSYLDPCANPSTRCHSSGRRRPLGFLSIERTVCPSLDFSHDNKCSRSPTVDGVVEYKNSDSSLALVDDGRRFQQPRKRVLGRVSTRSAAGCWFSRLRLSSTTRRLTNMKEQQG